MINCEHNFIVTNWKISAHSKSAAEMMCTKCLCNLNINGIGAARMQHLETFKAVQTQIRVRNESRISEVSETPV